MAKDDFSQRGGPSIILLGSLCAAASTHEFIASKKPALADLAHKLPSVHDHLPAQKYRSRDALDLASLIATIIGLLMKCLLRYRISCCRVPDDQVSIGSDR